MMTPPLSIWARPRLAVQVPVSGAWPLVVGAEGVMGSTVMMLESSLPGDTRTFGGVMYGCTDDKSLSVRGIGATGQFSENWSVTKVVLVDCFSGASGDMLLGALVDAGVSLDTLRAGLETLPVSGWSLTAQPALQHGISGTRVRVELDERDQPHRGLSEVLRIIRGGQLPETVAR